MPRIPRPVLCPVIQKKALISRTNGRGPPRQLRAEAPASRVEAEGAGLVQPGKLMAWEDQSAAYQYMWGCQQVKGARLLTVVRGGRKRDNSPKWYTVGGQETTAIN